MLKTDSAAMFLVAAMFYKGVAEGPVVCVSGRLLLPLLSLFSFSLPPFFFFSLTLCHSVAAPFFFLGSLLCPVALVPLLSHFVDFAAAAVFIARAHAAPTNDMAHTMRVAAVAAIVVAALAVATHADVVTLLCGALFEPRTGAVLTDRVVTITDGIVTNVSEYDRSVSRAHADMIVDLSDKFVLPGLVDAHTHLFLRPYNVVDWSDQVTRESVPQRTLRAAMYAKMTIESGFTTVRDLGTGTTRRCFPPLTPPSRRCR